MRVICYLAGALLATGCSPYGFNKEIGKFADGVTSMATAFEDGSKGARADYVKLQEAAFEIERPRLRLDSGCGVLGNMPCDLHRLQPAAVDIASASQAVQLDAAVSRTRPILKALSDYGLALEAITKASDRADFDAASSRLSTSVAAMTAALNLVVPGAGAIPPAVIKGVTFLVGTGLDAERRATLSAQVHVVQPAIVVVAKVLGDGLYAIQVYRIGIVEDATSRLADSLGPSTSPSLYESRLIQVQDGITELNNLRAVKPREAAMAMTDAHAKLVAALDDPSRNTMDLIIAVASFAEEAESLETALAKPSK